MSVLDRVRAALPALPPAQQRVAALVLADPGAFTRQPVGRLAERGAVSKPTVVRFCRGVGFEGLTDFKRQLASSNSDGVPFVHRAVDEGDAPGEIVGKVIDNAVAAMLAFRAAAAGDAFERAIAALTQAARTGKRVEFYGVGNSGIVAQDAQHKFFRLGVHTQAISDGHVQVMSATLLGAGDCAVFISNSGRSRDLIDSAHIAHRNGATTILLTASDSPLSRTARGPRQLVLAVDHPEDHDRYSPMVSRLLHLIAVDILATGVALQLPSAQRGSIRRMKKNVSATRYVAAS